jgi:cytochrome bd-type quinol oxidase subunit 2
VVQARVSRHSERVVLPGVNTSHMAPFIQGLLIGFFGAGLYVAVDTYETDRTLAFVLKCLVLMWGGAAVIHCTGLFGAGFF